MESAASGAARLPSDEFIQCLSLLPLVSIFKYSGVEMNLKSQLIVKKNELSKNLYDRRFSLAGIDFSLQKEIDLKVFKNEINPKSYWHIIPIKKIEGPPQFTSLMRDYHTAAMVQVAFFEVTLHKDYEESMRIENPRKRAMHSNKALMDLSEILGWGFYYWAFAEDFYGRVQRAYALKAKKGGDAKAAKREESDVLLSCLVKSQLEYFSPSAQGWPNTTETARFLTKSIEQLVAENKLPIGQRKDLLGDIFYMIDEDYDVNKVYKKFSKKVKKS